MFPNHKQEFANYTYYLQVKDKEEIFRTKELYYNKIEAYRNASKLCNTYTEDYIRILGPQGNNLETNEICTIPQT